ncbi:MAG TPA: methyltransferase domain-containing protein [Syntrophorhabdaceae bacterium]|jgi:2-polyprenyl-3-methyl-5-hydroxy-6-metoxy-1,4-benzoquinol methylase
MENPSGEWSKLFAYRDKIHGRYRDIWDVPRVKKRSHLLARYLKDGMRVLDVGAGMKGMKGEIEKLGMRVTYKSMDIDRGNAHDYYDLADINEKFDAVIMFEVIEHLDLEGGLALLRRLHDILGPKGIIILSTPNIFNPSRYMRDATHRTFYGYDELCGLLMLAGFGIKDVYRSFNDAIHRYVLKVYVLGFLFRLLTIDYAISIFAVGEKE